MTKAIKRPLALLFILVLLLSLALPAYAAEGLGEEPAINGKTVPGEEGEKTLDGGEIEADYAEFFIAATGSDESGDGSRDLPFASLARAAEAANAAAEDTVYLVLLTDLTSTKLARFYGKEIILTSDAEPRTVTRGPGFEPAFDRAYGMYNPALLECGRVEGTELTAAQLRVENVILDDAGAHEGTDYALPQRELPEGEDNLSRVQNAIIAAYDGGAGIVLGSGAELRNYGGMSAVYVGGDSSLLLEDYSLIGDTAALPAQEGASAVTVADNASLLVAEKARIYEHGAPVAAEPVPEEQEPVMAPLSLSDGGFSAAAIGDGLTDREFSSLELTAPESVTRLQDGLLRYEVPYALTFSLTETAADLIETAADLINDSHGTVTITLDQRLTPKNAEEVDYSFESSVFTCTAVTAEENVITAEFQLKTDWKQHLSELQSPMSFTCTGLLARDQFEDDSYLVTKGQVSLLLRTSSHSYDLSSKEKEASTKMLPPSSATVRYDANGGEGAPAAEFVSAQTAYKLNTDTVPTHESENGKPVVFIGWTAERDTTLYAEKDDPPSTVETIDVEALSINTVYAVYGYDENEDGIADVVQTLVTLYYDANGGEGAPDPETKAAVADVGARFDISELEPTRRYYSFQGWSKDQDATEADYKYDADKKADRDLVIVRDTTLYAVWEQNPTYTLYYNANGGTNAPAAQSAISENGAVELTITSAQPTRAGYTFVGWATTRRGSAEYFAGDSARITNGNVMLYAVWEKGASSYTGGGSSGSGSGTSASGAPKTGDENNPTLYIVLLILSLAAIAAVVWIVLKRRKKDQ